MVRLNVKTQKFICTASMNCYDRIDLIFPLSRTDNIGPVIAITFLVTGTPVAFFN